MAKPPKAAESRVEPQIRAGALWLPRRAVLLRTITGVSWAHPQPGQYKVWVHIAVADLSIEGPEFSLMDALLQWSEAVMTAVSNTR